jgi:6-phosphogluconolactonase
VALSGGNTPAPVYRALARSPDLSWPNVAIFFGDERAVPPTDPASNFRMASESLLDQVPLSANQVHRMEAERPDRDAAAAAYAAILPDRFDLMLLGLGDDGHTASLFPHAPTLTERLLRVVPAAGPTPPVHRLTVTPPVLAAARATVVLVTGPDKAAMVARVLEGPDIPDTLPAQLVRGGAWFLDDTAASMLRTKDGH